MSREEALKMAKNKAAPLLERLEQELASGSITESEWYERVAAVVTPAYLSGGNPRAESGHSGDSAQWEWARSLVLDAVHRNGSFLDIGCANGHLMESLEGWAAARGLSLELHGLDIAPELVNLALARLPRFRGRIHQGNAIAWPPPRRYDFVRTGLEYVPRSRRAKLVEHLMQNLVAPGGRLIIGVFNEEKACDTTADFLRASGFAPAGRASRAHRSHPELEYKVVWLDSPGS